MDSDFYKKAQTAAMKELGELLEKRVALERRITKLRQGIASLDALILDEDETPSEFMQELSEVGITDACRNALKVATSPRTPIEVRDWLDNSGYALSENALAAIHTILKRLAVNGEAETVVNAKGKVAYQWTGQGSILEQLAMGSVENEKADPALVQSIIEGMEENRRRGQAKREQLEKEGKKAPPTIRYRTAEEYVAAKEQEKKVIEPFVGQGSVDIVLTNPPYAEGKKEQVMSSEPKIKPSVTYEGLPKKERPLAPWDRKKKKE
jgi:DNA-directed RNA polymerase subunit F